MASFADNWECETRPTMDLVSTYLADLESDEGSHALQVIHFRAGREEFDAGAQLARSDCHHERMAGADILGQLGWAKFTFLEESVEILIGLLGDPCDDVIESAAIALGHRNHRRAISPLIALSKHPSDYVRWGVVHGLSRHDDMRAVCGLIELSHDPDVDVRDWATFGIAQMTSLDTPEIREALLERTEDDDPEVRGEALMGLAQRQDARVLPYVQRELNGDFHGSWAVEAAEMLADTALYPALQSLDERLDEEEREYFAWNLKQALQACRPRE